MGLTMGSPANKSPAAVLERKKSFPASREAPYLG